MPDENYSKPLPALPLNLSQHRLYLTVAWTTIIVVNGILPIVIYFALHYGTSLDLSLVLTIPTIFMGLTSIWQLYQRTYYLLTNRKSCRPLGMTSPPNKWYKNWSNFDYFQWNYLFGFTALTILISVGTSIPSLPPTSVSLSALMLYVCLELILVEICIALKIPAPFRFSSIPKGAPLRPGVFIVAEDVVAVDGKQGGAWRQAWNDRFEADFEFQRLCRVLDWAWGVSGLCIVAVIWGLALSSDTVNEEVAYAIGWGLPWIWGGVMTILTIRMAKKMLRRQRARVGGIDDSGV
ncbi:uncharacterized protein MYCFIDRAFT_55867 [Pseudocercospora fijiensis CIRAD86]|uniref:Uncharacterized protein n=1 Tax=Pseudocercospora fijiensis (strain CIRAD86) TaxID=383855 RepID=N1QCY5_PSEFD|nr:uncharacterized protein MYCFIDRAFT_55867 [Pseudocercospora fijiensis CIRAD86]EME89458.1 hypothetical protein MYCFIDRAFT_55867 [Pseudocercospora fijiensis CIRAD86]